MPWAYSARACARCDSSAHVILDGRDVAERGLDQQVASRIQPVPGAGAADPSAFRIERAERPVEDPTARPENHRVRRIRALDQDVIGRNDIELAVVVLVLVIDDRAFAEVLDQVLAATADIEREVDDIALKYAFAVSRFTKGLHMAMA